VIALIVCLINQFLFTLNPTGNILGALHYDSTGNLSNSVLGLAVVILPKRWHNSQIRLTRRQCRGI